nr:MAG TPA: hypothetical protein [Caudoviricetes sp.]
MSNRYFKLLCDRLPITQNLLFTYHTILSITYLFLICNT